MQFTVLNEMATLEWLDAERLIMRFEYVNGFYGSCTFVARIAKHGTGLSLDRSSLSSEEHTVKRGELSSLLKLATCFLERLLLRNRSLEDLGCLPRLAKQPLFSTEVADSTV